MKSTLPFILFLCTFSFSLQAQKITLDPVHTVQDFSGVNLTSNEIDLEKHIAVTNNTSGSINLIWNRVITENCPVEWETQVCDNLSCYFFSVFSNVSDELGIDKPFVLAEGETFNDFIFHVWPRMVPGCCTAKIEFSTIEEPDVIIETAVFDISVNSPECDFGTSTHEISEAQLVSVFPNPTTDAFTLSNNDVINQVDLFNTLGQKLRSFQFTNGEYMDVSDLNSGIYSLVLKNKKGETLNSVFLNKE